MDKYSYLAGIIDGEGHIHKPLIKNGRGEGHYYARIIVVNTNKDLINWLKSEFGGSIATSKARGSSQTSYRWTVQGKAAESLGRIVQPLLICKKDQITRII